MKIEIIKQMPHGKILEYRNGILKKIDKTEVNKNPLEFDVDDYVPIFDNSDAFRKWLHKNNIEYKAFGHKTLINKKHDIFNIGYCWCWYNYKHVRCNQPVQNNVEY